jgi:hypothetical protein
MNKGHSILLIVSSPVHESFEQSRLKDLFFSTILLWKLPGNLDESNTSKGCPKNAISVVRSIRCVRYCSDSCSLKKNSARASPHSYQ